MKTEMIVSLSKQKTLVTEERAIIAISKMKEKGQKISVYKIHKITGISESFLRKNESVFNLIKENRREVHKEIKVESKDSIIRIQKKRIFELELQVKKLEAEAFSNNGDNYKRKCERLQKQVTELNERLMIAYHY